MRGPQEPAPATGPQNSTRNLATSGPDRDAEEPWCVRANTRGPPTVPESRWTTAREEERGRKNTDTHPETRGGERREAASEGAARRARATRRLLWNTITPRLEHIRRKLCGDPPQVDAARDRIDALLGTIADEHARLDAADSVDRGRAAGLADDVEEHD